MVNTVVKSPEQKIEEHLMRMGPERLLNRNRAKEWIGTNREMVSILGQFEEWDLEVIDTLTQLFNQRMQELSDEGIPEAAKEFKARWVGWIAEASVQRIFDNLGIKLMESEELDAKGIDFMKIEHNLPDGTSHYVYLQVKAKSSVDVGMFFFEAYGAEGTDIIPGTQNIVFDVLNGKQLDKFQEDGDTHQYCEELTREMWKKLVAHLKSKGKSIPDTHQVFIFLGGIGVGMNPGRKNKTGWVELMKLVGNKDPKLMNTVRKSLIQVLSQPTKKRL